jgi:hypothetical protein
MEILLYLWLNPLWFNVWLLQGLSFNYSPSGVNESSDSHQIIGIVGYQKELGDDIRRTGRRNSIQ